MRFTLSLLVVEAMLLTSAELCHCESAADAGAADSLDLVLFVQPVEETGDACARLDLYGFNDASAVVMATAGFAWGDPGMVMDSASISDLSDSAFNYLTVLFYKTNIDSTNAHRCFQFSGIRTAGAGIPPAAERRLWASYYFTIHDWVSGDSIVVDTVRYSNGTTFTFCGPDGCYSPVWAGPAVGYETSTCCVGTRGNIDCSSDDLVTMGDFTALTDHLFISYAPLCCLEEADLNNDGSVNMADHTILIDHLFISYAPLSACQ